MDNAVETVFQFWQRFTFTRYLAASIVALAFDVASFSSLVATGISATTASATGYSIGIVIHWMVSAHYVFPGKTRDGSALQWQRVLFAGSALLGLAITVATVTILSGQASTRLRQRVLLWASVLSRFTGRANGAYSANALMEKATHNVKPLLILWLIISAILIFSARDVIINRSGWDPDDQLRLVQLRDFLGGQSWFDTNQYRLNPPYGAPMHWSRLIELPLALVVLITRPFFGQAIAEMIAGTLVPLITLGLLAYILGRIATRLGDAKAGVIAIFLTLTSTALLPQMQPMRIDHHGWQILLAAVALWTMFGADKKRSGVVLGLALATWMHISLEGLPAAAAFFCS